MTIYYVYQLIDPRNGKPFYVGKGSGNRASQHIKFKDGNNNPHKDRVIRKIISEGLVPKVDIIYDNIHDESHAYDLEEELIASIGLENLTNIVADRRPPSKKGWTPTEKTLHKRSQKLKGIPRTTEWRQKLSEAKKGEKNPMYGKKIPCSEERRLAILRGKNRNNLSLYTDFLIAIKTESVSNAYKRLGIGKGVAFRLANGSHGIFDAFPELVELL